jgi:uncharacterized protein
MAPVEFNLCYYYIVPVSYDKNTNFSPIVLRSRRTSAPHRRMPHQHVVQYAAMDNHVLTFVNALRTAGVRVSLAESIDALRALLEAGVDDRAVLRDTLRATLIKESADRPTFERLFDAYFSAAGAPLIQTGSSDALATVDLARLHTTLDATMARIDSPTLARLFEAMVAGHTPSQQELGALLATTTPVGTGSPIFLSWMTRRTLRELQFSQLDALLGDLLAGLQAAGMDTAALAEVERSARGNMEALAEQIGRAVASQMARQEGPRPTRTPTDELIDLPLRLLSDQDDADLRAAVARLAEQLRTRAALRRRRARRGPLDPRATLRASMRYGGVPFALRQRRRQLKPRLVVLCDLSRSMRALAGLTLTLVYALHDQLSGTRAFAYIDDLHDISAEFADARPAQAVAVVLDRIRAEYTRTDLGSCLDSFDQHYLTLVDRRTTVLILGDGRNNRSDPGLASLRQIRDRARHLIWFTPEPRRDWGSGDSDMLAYAPICSAVHVVGSLRQLSAAVGNLFG